jgi:glycosyltransferase involved in cell wall biosynthesis
VTAGGREALLVAYEFPPRQGTPAQRLGSLAEGLRDRGWRVRVATVRSLHPRKLFGPAQGPPPPDGVELLRVPALAVPVHQLASAGHRRAAGLVDALLPVDHTAPWAAAAIPLLLGALARRPADVVLASGPPFTSLVVGATLARLTGAPLVIELRDPWVDNPLVERPAARGPLGPALRALDARLEASCWRAADRVFVTAQGLADVLTRRYADVPRPVDVVRNGWRPDARGLDRAPPVLDSASVRPMRWLYPGTIIPGSPYTPEPLLDALARLVDAGRLPADAVRTRLLTNHPAELERWRARHPRVAPCISVEPFRPRAEAIAAYAETDAFLLGYPDYPGVPGKAYEFMATGKPVLLVAPPGETRSLLERAGVGLAVDRDDPAAADSLVERVVMAFRRGEPLAQPDWPFIDGFSSAAQVARACEALAEVADQARARTMR